MGSPVARPARSRRRGPLCLRGRRSASLRRGGRGQQRRETRGLIDRPDLHAEEDRIEKHLLQRWRIRLPARCQLNPHLRFRHRLRVALFRRKQRCGPAAPAARNSLRERIMRAALLPTEPSCARRRDNLGLGRRVVCGPAEGRRHVPSGEGRPSQPPDC